MKTCQKCGKEFPNNKVIDGIRRNFQRRKFCLECSPFGSHNTVNLNESKGEDYYSCKICGIKHDGINFYYNRGKPTSYCKKCFNSKTHKNGTTRGHQRKQEIVDYKGGCCQICGYDKTPRALCFHHIDETTKSFNLDARSCATRKIELLKEEADKCILLCHNCHMEVHDGLVEVQ